MTATISPVAQYNASTNLTIPVDGELAGFQTGPAPLQAPLQAMADREAYAFLALDAQLTWSNRARVAPGGTNNGDFKVFVSPIQVVVLYDGTKWRSFQRATELELTSTNSFSSGTLAADKNYYVYAKVVSDALAFEVSLTEPDSARMWKNATVGTHRFLFSFRTNSSGVALPMTMEGGTTLYRYSAITNTELRCLNTTAEALASTNLILGRGGLVNKELVPSYARQVYVRSEITTTGNHANDWTTAYFVSKDDASGNTVQHDVNATTSNVRSERDFWIECDASATIQYSLSFTNTDSGDPTGTLNVYVLGWRG